MKYEPPERGCLGIVKVANKNKKKKKLLLPFECLPSNKNFRKNSIS